MLAGFGAYIAWRQHWLDRNKARNDAFDRRYAIYDSLVRLFRSVGVSAGPSDDDLIKFDADTGPAVFLFEPDITRYLDEVRERLVDACNIADFKRDDTFSSPGEREVLLKRGRDHKEWFRVQVREARHVFAPHMRIKL